MNVSVLTHFVMWVAITAVGFAENGSAISDEDASLKMALLVCLAIFVQVILAFLAHFAARRASTRHRSKALNGKVGVIPRTHFGDRRETQDQLDAWKDASCVRDRSSRYPGTVYFNQRKRAGSCEELQIRKNCDTTSRLFGSPSGMPPLRMHSADAIIRRTGRVENGESSLWRPNGNDGSTSTTLSTSTDEKDCKGKCVQTQTSFNIWSLGSQSISRKCASCQSGGSNQFDEMNCENGGPSANSLGSSLVEQTRPKSEDIAPCRRSQTSSTMPLVISNGSEVCVELEEIDIKHDERRHLASFQSVETFRGWVSRTLKGFHRSTTPRSIEKKSQDTSSA